MNPWRDLTGGSFHPLPRKRQVRPGGDRAGTERSLPKRARGVERVTFLLEEGRKFTLTPGDPQLRHLDHAWASTVHAYQGRTVDNMIAAMEANHPQLTTARAFYVEISRARDRAELVADDAQALKERLEAVTGERISVLEGIGETVRPEREREHRRDGKESHERERPSPEAPTPSPPEREVEPEVSRARVPEHEPPAKGKRIEMDLGL